MKVICLVPSWTEMLVEAGINVVGRTRFCIHPQSQIQSIAVVGGTKDLNWEKVRDLHADLLILDQEENPLWMKEQSPLPVLTTHVTGISQVAREIDRLAEVLQTEKLRDLSDRWRQIEKNKLQWNWQKIPSEMQLIRRDFESYQQLVYVIWKKPWMSVSPETFIGSVLQNLGAEIYLPKWESKYPSFELRDFDLQKTFFLFSSEPYPFHQKLAELRNLGVQGSIVDGECYSWFGVRALRFLERTHSSATY